MSKEQSQAAYDRVKSIWSSMSGDKRYGWSDNHYIDEKRNARGYVDSSDERSRVIELNHGNLHITLAMYGMPPDDANLEFANTIMDAAEHIIKEGVKKK